MGIRKIFEEAMATTTRAMKIQETRVVLMELVITATSLDIARRLL